MATERNVPSWVLRGVSQVLTDHPSGVTTRELAWTLSVSIGLMYQYVTRLHQLGQLEPAGLAPPKWKRGPRPKVWRWAG